MGVCRSWRSSASNPTTLPHQPPLIALPTEPTSAAFYLISPRTRTAHSVHLPKTLCFAIFGSSSGWLIMVNKNFDCFLFNPLTLSKIPLPSLPSAFVRNLPQNDYVTVIHIMDCFAFSEPYPDSPRECDVAFTDFEY